jgi:flagellar biosynthetic protein FliR
MNELTNGLMVFLRVSAMLAVFPVFSTANFPVQLRLALGALLAILVAPNLPTGMPPAHDMFGLVGVMAMEVGVGLLFGFASRMIFYALDMAGGIISSEIGLTLPPGLDPMSGGQVTAPGSLLYYLAAVLWLSLDLHHWMLVGFMKTYTWLPIGGAHLPQVCLADFVTRTSQTFVIALQLAAPVMAVSFIVSLVFSVLGRAVPQMNVFQESFAVRTLGGLSVFGLTLQLMAEHIANYVRRLPEDMLSVAQMMGAH